jgi:CRISPR-associated endoribonuclease Cas6
MMHHLLLTLTPTEKPINGRFITTRGLHGLLFNSLKQHNPAETDWLHTHDSPKPFSMVPLYNPAGHLAGLRYATLTPRTTDLFLTAWQTIAQSRQVLQLGRYQTFQITAVETIPGPTFQELSLLPPSQYTRLHFLSPTAFKQGPGSLPLPLPINVFQGPFRVWQAFAPFPLPDDWLEWCAQELFVVEHRIETAVTAITQQEQFTGFVGTVTFRAYAGNEEQLRIWQALGALATYCGIGHKTTMGMGAVDLA